RGVEAWALRLGPARQIKKTGGTFRGRLEGLICFCELTPGPMLFGNRSTTISGVSPEPSGIGSSGTSSKPRRGVAATDSKRTQVAAIARINRLKLKYGLRLCDMATTPQRVVWDKARLAAARTNLSRRQLLTHDLFEIVDPALRAVSDQVLDDAPVTRDDRALRDRRIAGFILRAL